MINVMDFVYIEIGEFFNVFHIELVHLKSIHVETNSSYMDTD